MDKLNPSSITLERLLRLAYDGASANMCRFQQAAFQERLAGRDASSFVALADEAYREQQQIFSLIYGE